MNAIDPDALKMFAFQVFSKLEGAVTAGMIHLGEKLGLYAVMSDEVPRTSHELASAANLDERWVREWVHNQAAARLVQFDADERFWLTPEAVAVFATPSHPAFAMGMFGRLPNTMDLLHTLPESFRTGIGYDYDAHGAEGAAGIERSFEPWYRNFLLPVGISALDGVKAKLEKGAVAADVGCGAGVAVRVMAKGFSASQFHGYDVSAHALERAERRRAEEGLANAHFHNVRSEPLPEDGRFDLITTFDCIHDMTHPTDMMRSIRRAISPDGVWLLVDIKAKDTFAENLANPMASLMYGISVMSCMSSALSEPGGEGLGTLGLPESKARAMTEAAGFSRFRRLEIDHAMNAFYEVRP